mmetsp:Transcript_39882/g.106551  ORF Transcript_39882/g.106551 Transcript_39882/m.106551 type:complete len:413 (+) Transcript_39882:414-1652(+)
MKSLKLSMNRLGDSKLQSLVPFDKLRALTVLDLSSNKLGPDSKSSLANALQGLHSLKQLFLGMALINGEHTQEAFETRSDGLKVANLVPALVMMKNLELLDVSGLSMGPSGARVLAWENMPEKDGNSPAEGLGVPQRRGISLSTRFYASVCCLPGSCFGSTVMDGRLKMLTDLDFSLCKLGDSGLEALEKFIVCNTKLTRLNLMSSQLTPRAAPRLNAVLSSLPDLQDLGLGSYPFAAVDDKNYFPVTELHVLANKKLMTKLDLSALKIDSTFTTLLCPLANLKSLNLSSNDLKCAGDLNLETTLKSLTCLELLDLSKNDILLAGLATVKDALHFMTLLTSLNISKNPLGDQAAASIAAALSSTAMHNLKSLNIRHVAAGASKVELFQLAIRSPFGSRFGGTAVVSGLKQLL